MDKTSNVFRFKERFGGICFSLRSTIWAVFNSTLLCTSMCFSELRDFTSFWDAALNETLLPPIFLHLEISKHSKWQSKHFCKGKNRRREIITLATYFEMFKVESSVFFLAGLSVKSLFPSAVMILVFLIDSRLDSMNFELTHVWVLGLLVFSLELEGLAWLEEISTCLEKLILAIRNFTRRSCGP